MSEIKNLKYIDLSSTTTIGTGVSVLFSLVLSLAIIILGGLIGGMNLVSVLIYIISTIIFGTLVYSIFNIFAESYLYNVLVSKFNPISLKIKDNQIIEEISVMSTAIIAGLISIIIFIVIYLASIYLVPMFLYSLIQNLMFSGAMDIGLLLYQILNIYTNPIFMILLLLISFICVLIITAISCLVYNLLSQKIVQIKVELSEINGLTSIDYINPLYLAIMSAVISLVVNLIMGIILAIVYGDFMTILVNSVTGFVSGFIVMYILASFYNILSKKLGTVKVKLINN